MALANYINSNFTSIDDLQFVNAKVDALGALNEQVRKIVADKLSGLEGAPSGGETEPELDKSKLNDAVEKIISVVSVVTTLDDLKESYDNVTALLHEFGDVPVLRELQIQIKKKQVAEIQKEYLLKCQQIETKLASNTSLEDLRSLSSDVTESNAPELISQLEHEISRRKEKFVDELRQLVKESRWLNKATVTKEALSLIAEVTEKLIQLQAIRNTPSYPGTWWAMECLLEPLNTRFHYHFDTPNKDTNKLSKPEWALSFVENCLEDSLPVINIIVEEPFKKVGKVGTYEAITTLLVPVRNKMNKVIQVINTNLKSEYDNKVREKYGVLLSHLIFELSTFDQRLRNKYKYNPYSTISATPAKEKWTGITGDILLDEHNRAFESWLEFEKTLAIKRFNNEIMSANDWMKIDFDYQPNKRTGKDTTVSMKYLRPTFSAYGLVKLVENLNSHVQTLSIVKFQLKYVSSIQLHLLDLYLEQLIQQHKQLTDKNTKSVLTMIPGGIDTDTKSVNKRETEVITSLEKLTEIYCSTKFVGDGIEKWNAEIVFVQLWKMYQSFTTPTSDLERDEGLFSAISNKFEELLDRTLHSYLGILRVEIKQLLKPYVNTGRWDSDLDAQESDIVPSPNLAPLINTLPTYLDIVEKSVSRIDYFAVTNMAVTVISDLLYEYVITNNRFSKVGVRQLISDFNYLVSFLHATLLLNTRRSSSITRFDDYTLSNDGNRSYVKVVQAIDVLDSVSSSKAAMIRTQRNALDKLRSDYGHGIDALSNGEVLDLLGRIQL
ncbi:hypothetical protein KGF57_000234 [Candida theae]|uniref:Uncharacterized protein n=1 Tax=Candida theae TaxID=1198502 RepID=A0AAD5BJU7_9ASCO|nr:uncharacterized protein KGF57_000234 [Candida theae]KAI5968185.1 hypothetical protein KGF57_000234 [Candida theae]